MPDIGNLNRPKLMSHTVDLGDGDTVGLVFDVNALTPAVLDLPMAEALPRIIREWDVTDDGRPFPPVTENMEKLSYAVQTTLVRELVRAATPSDAEGNASSPSANDPSSDSVPESQTFPNGSAASNSPTVSESQLSR